MSRDQSHFSWYELATPDPEAAKAFYGKVVGWKAEPMPPSYTILKPAGEEHPVGGMMQLTDEMKAMGVPPCWTGYVGVRELEPVIDKLSSLGGSVRRPATDIPDVGRFAVVADPQGAAFILFEPKAGAEPPPQGEPRPGHITWRELMTTDWESAFAFYSALFGWTKFGEHDMGPMGTYLLFAINGERAGGMMNGGPQCPGAFWGYYFLTDSATAAAERVKAAGGQVLMGPHEVPDGQWIIQATDPQGAHFAMVGPK